LRAASRVDVERNPGTVQQDKACVETQKPQRPETNQDSYKYKEQDCTFAPLSEKDLPCSGNDGRE
jgi:hypothetical protein